MKINFKSFIAAALVALVLTSCTDEADVLDNTPIMNKKSFTSLITRPYPEYEDIDVTAEEAINLVSNFDEAMKGETELESINIPEAVLAMETYFNYGVVAKQEITDTTSYYNFQIFQFEVQLDAQGNINGAELVTAYTNFLNNLLGQMNGKYLQFSDLFVKAKGDNSIIFALELPKFDEYDVIVKEPHKCKTLNSPDGPFDIPNGAHLDWTNYRSYDYDDIDYRASELCSTYEVGFIYKIFTDEQICFWANPLIIDDVRINPFLVEKSEMEGWLLPGLINQAHGYRPNTTSTFKIMELLCGVNKKRVDNGTRTQAKSGVKQITTAFYDYTPNWLVIDNIIF